MEVVKNPYVAPGIKSQTEKINEAAAKVWGISVDQLFIKTRKREFVEPRQVVIYHRKESLRESAKTIAKDFKTAINRCSVYSSCKEVNNLLETNKVFRSMYFKFLEEFLK